MDSGLAMYTPMSTNAMAYTSTNCIATIIISERINAINTAFLLPTGVV